MGVPAVVARRRNRARARVPCPRRRARQSRRQRRRGRRPRATPSCRSRPALGRPRRFPGPQPRPRGARAGSPAPLPALTARAARSLSQTARGSAQTLGWRPCRAACVAGSVSAIMTDPETLRLQLELCVADAVPIGRFIGPGGETISFEGWLQLLGALERVIGSAEKTGPPPRRAADAPLPQSSPSPRMEVHVQTSRIGLTIAAALLATPASAQALPTFTTDRACYAAEWDYMRINGRASRPGRRSASSSPTTAGLATSRHGRWRRRLRDGSAAFRSRTSTSRRPSTSASPPTTRRSSGRMARSARPRRPSHRRGADQRTRRRRRGVERGRAGDRPPRPAAEVAGRRLGRAGSELYVHYQRGGRTVRSERLGALTGPAVTCAPRSAHRVPACPAGTYAVRFTTAPKWSAKDSWIGYRASPR